MKREKNQNSYWKALRYRLKLLLKRMNKGDELNKLNSKSREYTKVIIFINRGNID